MKIRHPLEIPRNVASWKPSVSVRLIAIEIFGKRIGK
jgi:hypothetical protein